MVLLEGPLSKWTNVMKGWQFRWFVLEENSGLLSYYTSKEKMMKGVRRGCVRLKGAVIGIDDQDVNTFTITVDHKTFHFQAKDGEEREKWVRRLEDTILRHANRNRGIWSDPGGSTYGGLGSAGDPSKRPNYLQTLDKRISEADAYLQLMIEQTNKIENKLKAAAAATAETDASTTDAAAGGGGAESAESSSGGGSGGDVEAAKQSKQSEISNTKEMKDPNAVLQESAHSMLESFKHSIVLLQIAKNTAHPVNGIYQGPASVSATIAKPMSGLSDRTPDSTDMAPSSLPSGIVEYGAECIEKKFASTKLAGAIGIDPSLSLAVPETSYSSSEGEDDFYDANDNPYSSSISLKDAEDTLNEQSEEMKSCKSQTDPNSSRDSLTTTPIRVDGSIDYDALYEEDDANDAVSMESHGSVVTHLLSQVKIGMDLTKVVLPTFILERRSLLEMYADYFAHPDLFVRIADFKDPRERMVQVVKWYMSSYHAGRKSAVAKKPYNPILGEIFRCHWDTPEHEPDSTLVTDGPVPWCRRDQLTFVAEQVCHHPPISAFYAEHYNKKISFTAYVWTKSKFLGLSIGVHNIGQGIVTLSEYNEEYIVTFPNGYGRSILTVPWIELGGSVQITCPQTGYRADIEFLTKPFYGGRRNRITAEVYAPNEKKSFLSVNGEWSAAMEAKWNDGHKKPEVFVDVNKIPIFKKNVRPIADQVENESRRIWVDVTAGLRFNDIDRATTAKQKLEQKQRDEAKQRKEANLEWETKYFKPVGDVWIYTNPLSQRLYEQEKQRKLQQQQQQQKQ